MSDWYDDDSFWETFQNYMFDSRRLGLASAEVDQMIALLGLKSGGAVLDLCSGIGRHSIEFARRGFKVTGVDRTTPYLDQARSSAAKENLKIEFVRSDMREFSRPAAFDAAINFFTAFGYFENPADDAKVARNLGDSLKPGGRLIVDTMGKEVIARKFRERDWGTREDGAIVLEERRVLDGWKRLESRWTRIYGSERRSSTLLVRLYSGAELESLLREVGFREVDLYGSLSATPYDQNAERLVAVASK
nr:putative methyltransferase [uncultured bacterium]